VSKRTTLTLDDDVADGLAAAARRSGRSFRDVVNETIRRGLHQREVDRPYRVVAAEMHRRSGIEIDDIEGLLDLLDGPGRR
jgi:hypothetical protein